MTYVCVGGTQGIKRRRDCRRVEDIRCKIGTQNSSGGGKEDVQAEGCHGVIEDGECTDVLDGRTNEGRGWQNYQARQPKLYENLRVVHAIGGTSAASSTLDICLSVCWPGVLGRSQRSCGDHNAMQCKSLQRSPRTGVNSTVDSAIRVLFPDILRHLS
jgi:hypothetical protein